MNNTYNIYYLMKNTYNVSINSLNIGEYLMWKIKNKIW